MTDLWNDEYGMYSDDDGHTWRGFAQHHPSGDIYILVQDNVPGHEAGMVGVGGPLHHSEITRATLIGAIWDDEDVEWAWEQTWVSIPPTAGEHHDDA